MLLHAAEKHEQGLPAWSHRHVPYTPSLDGLRAVAVAAVVAFHAQAPWMPGGFVGVTLFFTLSGFLITSLLVSEFHNAGRVDIVAFIGRRLRRLAPAALLVLLLVVALSTTWSASQREGLSGDVLASVFHVANWRNAFHSVSYSELFSGDQSPLLHMWSLSVEEQIYLLLPVLAWVGLRRRGIVGLRVVLTLALVGSLIAVALTSSRTLAYYGTHTRAAEVIIGALGATLPWWRLWRGRRAMIAGVVAFAVLAAFSSTTSVTTPWVYRGGLVVAAAAALPLIIATAQHGFISRVLGVRPLVAIGKLSYGIYLFHWPVFGWLTSQRLGFSGPALICAQLALTLALAIASSVLVERPVRTGQLFANKRRLPLAIWAGAVSVVAVLAVTIVAVPPSSTTFSSPIAVAADGRVLPGPGAAAAATSTLAPPLPLPLPPPLPLLLLGSSAAAADMELEGPVIDLTADCAIAEAEQVKSRTVIIETPGCASAALRWAQAIHESPPFRAVVIALDESADGIPRSVAESGFPEYSDTEAWLERIQRRRTETKEAFAATFAALQSTNDLAPMFVFWDGPLDSEVYRTVLLQTPVVDAVATDSQGLQSLLLASTATATGQPGLRVLVVGDSTAQSLAAALGGFRDPAGRAPFDTAYWGALGCPWSRVEAVRGSSQKPWSELRCPQFDDDLPELVSGFDPQVVIVVIGPTDLSEQRYPGDPSGYVAGDSAYTNFHVREMTALAELLPLTTKVFIATTPAISPGPFSSSAMSDPARALAANDAMSSLPMLSDRFITLDMGAAIDDQARTDGDTTSDGVHVRVEVIVRILEGGMADEILASGA